MTPEQFTARVAEAEARANLAWGALVNRHTTNAGHAGDTAEMRNAIQLLALQPQRREIEAALAAEIDALEAEFYG